MTNHSHIQYFNGNAHKVIHKGSVAELETLFKNGYTLDQLDERPAVGTFLEYAVNHDCFNAIAWLLQHNANPNFSTSTLYPDMPNFPAVALNLSTPILSLIKFSLSYGANYDYFKKNPHYNYKRKGIAFNHFAEIKTPQDVLEYIDNIQPQAYALHYHYIQAKQAFAQQDYCSAINHLATVLPLFIEWIDQEIQDSRDPAYRFKDEFLKDYQTRYEHCLTMVKQCEKEMHNHYRQGEQYFSDKLYSQALPELEAASAMFKDFIRLEENRLEQPLQTSLQHTRDALQKTIKNYKLCLEQCKHLEKQCQDAQTQHDLPIAELMTRSSQSPTVPANNSSYAALVMATSPLYTTPHEAKTEEEPLIPESSLRQRHKK